MFLFRRSVPRQSHRARHAVDVVSPLFGNVLLQTVLRIQFNKRKKKQSHLTKPIYCTCANIGHLQTQTETFPFLGQRRIFRSQIRSRSLRTQFATLRRTANTAVIGWWAKISLDNDNFLHLPRSGLVRFWRKVRVNIFVRRTHNLQMGKMKRTRRKWTKNFELCPALDMK